MKKTNQLTIENRAQIAFLCEQRLTFTATAAYFNVTHCCIIKKLKWYHETGDFKSKAEGDYSMVHNCIHHYAKTYLFTSDTHLKINKQFTE